MRPSSNADLLGIAGSRQLLDTPALVLDLDAFERNMALMMSACREGGVRLRPHAKTHKSVEIAKRQIAAGAIGICCAKLGEAEAMAEGGIDDILITSPVVGPRALRRLGILAGKVSQLAVVVDDREALDGIEAAMAASGQRLSVFVDLDVGLHRTGIHLRQAEDLVRAIADSPRLIFGGLQAYQGHLQHIHNRTLRADENAALWRDVGALRDRLVRAGIPCPTITGGGTGTFDLDIEAGVLTELQGGSYIFMDREYGAIEGDKGGALPFETALYVYTRVISRNQKVFVTTDAGTKSFATDGPLPAIIAGAPMGSGYMHQGDEQGAVVFSGTDGMARGPRTDEEILATVKTITALREDEQVPNQGGGVPLGSLVVCSVPHCDPTVNLYDHIHCVRGETLEAIWAVEARGRSQ